MAFVLKEMTNISSNSWNTQSIGLLGFVCALLLIRLTMIEKAQSCYPNIEENKKYHSVMMKEGFRILSKPRL